MALSRWQEQHLQKTLRRKAANVVKRAGDDPTLGTLQRLARQEGLVVRIEVEHDA